MLVLVVLPSTSRLVLDYLVVQKYLPRPAPPRKFKLPKVLVKGKKGKRKKEGEEGKGGLGLLY